MAVRSYQQILESNNARKAAVRAKLLAILGTNKAPDGTPLAPQGSCSYLTAEGATCIVGAMLERPARMKLSMLANRFPITWAVQCERLVSPQELGGMTEQEAATLQREFDMPTGMGALRRLIDSLFPEQP